MSTAEDVLAGEEAHEFHEILRDPVGLLIALLGISWEVDLDEYSFMEIQVPFAILTKTSVPGKGSPGSAPNIPFIP